MTGRVARAGASLAYTVSGTGPPVLLAHALGGDGSHWAWHVPVLATRFTVVACDLRGHGESTGGDGPCTLEMLADDLGAVADAVGADRVALVGASLGAEAALRLAARAPHRVGALVLVGCAGGRWPAAARARYSKLAARAQREGLVAIGDDLVALLLPHARHGGPEAARLRERLASRATPAQGAAAAALFTAEPLGRRGGAVVAPTLVLSGALDPLVPPAVARALAAALPHATCEILPGRGHLCVIEDPAGTARRIGAFLEDAWRR